MGTSPIRPAPQHDDLRLFGEPMALPAGATIVHAGARPPRVIVLLHGQAEATIGGERLVLTAPIVVGSDEAIAGRITGVTITAITAVEAVAVSASTVARYGDAETAVAALLAAFGER